MIKIITDFLLPATCVSCSVPIDTNIGLCHTCWSKIQIIGNEKCILCGYPFHNEGEDNENTICTNCTIKRPNAKIIRSACIYGDIVSSIIQKLKYQDKQDIVKIITPHLYRVLKQEIPSIDIITNIPMDTKSMIKRMYNQSQLLASSLSKYNRCKENNTTQFIPDLLIKIRETKKQTSLTTRQRQFNLKGAFIVNPKRIKDCQNKKILIVDDVITTGSTVEECAKAINRDLGGKTEAFCISFARTILKSG